MPRPKRPKPVRTVPLKSRAGKQQPNHAEIDVPASLDLPTTRATIKDSVNTSTTTQRFEKPAAHDQIRRTSRSSKHASPATSRARRSDISSGKPGLIEHDARSDRPVDDIHSKDPSKMCPTPSSQISGQAVRPHRPSTGAHGRGGLYQRVHGTPLAQSSLLGALQFKKRARQPSLLRQSRQTTPNSLNDLDVRDFEPDDESTPLIKALSQPDPNGKSSASSGSRKRKLVNPQAHAHKSQALQDGISISSNASSTGTESFDLPPDDEIDVPTPSLPLPVSRRTPSPHIFSDTLAPPASSSSPTKASPRVGRTGRQQSDVSKDRRAKIKPPKKLTQAVPLSTARLQNLLPRRRGRPKRHGLYDVPGSSDTELDVTNLGEDEDELSLHASTKMRRPKAPTDLENTQTKTKGRKTVTARPMKAKRPSMTYSRKEKDVEAEASETDEVTLDADTSLEIDSSTGKVMPVLDAKVKAEMRRLADRFREIDDYDMDFEEITASSSQMKDAR